MAKLRMMADGDVEAMCPEKGKTRSRAWGTITTRLDAGACREAGTRPTPLSKSESGLVLDVVLVARHSLVPARSALPSSSPTTLRSQPHEPPQGRPPAHHPAPL